MQDQNISPNPEPSTEKPASETPDIFKKSKKRSVIFIAGGAIILVAIIIGACIATNSIDLRKIIPGFGHYEKPQLKNDDILIGFEDKYFFMSKDSETMLRNAAKSFDLYEDSHDKTSTPWKKIEALDSFIKKNTGDDATYTPAYILRIVKTAKSETMTTAITMTTSNDGYLYASMSCQEKETTYEIDDMKFACNKTTKSSVEDMFEDQGDKAEVVKKAKEYEYKGYDIQFDYYNNNLISQIGIWLPIDNE
jgi:hypothetical protein